MAVERRQRIAVTPMLEIKWGQNTPFSQTDDRVPHPDVFFVLELLKAWWVVTARGSHKKER